MTESVKKILKESINTVEAQIMMYEVLLETLKSMTITGEEAEMHSYRRKQVESELNLNRNYLVNLKKKFKDIL